MCIDGYIIDVRYIIIKHLNTPMALVGVDDVDGFVFSFLSYTDLMRLSQCSHEMYRFLLRNTFWRDWCHNFHKLARYKMPQITWREYGAVWFIRSRPEDAHVALQKQIVSTNAFHIMNMMLSINMVTAHYLENTAKENKNIDTLDWLYQQGHIAKNYQADHIEVAIMFGDLAYIKEHFPLNMGISGNHLGVIIEFKSYPILIWLIEKGVKLASSRNISNGTYCDMVCKMGYVEVIRWFIDQGISPSDLGIDEIIDHDHIEVYKFLSEIPKYDELINNDGVISCIGQSCPESIIKWLFEKGEYYLTSRLFNMALSLEKNDLAVWMLDQDCPYDDETMILAGAVGNYEMFSSIIDETDVKDNPQNYEDVAFHAAINGHIDFLDRLKEEFGIVSDRITIDLTLESIKWMENNTDLRVSFDSDPTLDVNKVRWVMEQHVIPSQDWINNSFAFDCYEVIEYLLKKGYRPNIHEYQEFWRTDIQRLLLLMSYDINPRKEDIFTLRHICPELEQWNQ